MRPSLWLSAHKSGWSGRQPRVPVVVAVLTIFYVKRLTNEPLHYLLFLSSPSSWQVSVTCSRFSLPPRSATNKQQQQPGGSTTQERQDPRRHSDDPVWLLFVPVFPIFCVFWSFPRSIYFGIIHLFIIFVSSPSTILLCWEGTTKIKREETTSY